jgi:hypothetical protein
MAVGALAALPASPAAAAGTLVINEVESDLGAPGDWVELYNQGGASVDLSNYVLKDNDDGHTFTIPGGTTLSAGAFLPVDVAGSFGLGSGDSARLFAPGDLVNPIDSFTWTEHAAGGTWSRCPDGTDDFIAALSTRGAANSCTSAAAWPGGATVADADGAGALGGNVSGLAYEGSGTAAPGTIWGVRNNPSTLYKLTKSGGTWTAGTTNPLVYPSATGNPDAEGVTITDAGAAGGVYVATERNDDGPGSSTSRPAILRFVPTGAGGTLTATNDWNLTADLPGLEANQGLEAVAWVPDSYLTAKGFKTTGGTAYNPADYADHGTGLFFVGVEQDGAIVAYALNHSTNAFARVATVSNVFPSVMDLGFDPALQQLRVVCDNNCNGRSALFDVQTAAGGNQGKFVSTAIYERPAGMANLNNEGFTVAANSECASGVKPAFWADDSNTGGHVLRAGTIGCTAGGATGPSITGAASSSKPRTAAGWYGTPVTVSFTCAAGSAPLAGSCPAAVTLTTSAADQSVTRTVTDANGQSAQATVSDLDIDLVKPTAKITGVKKGKTYASKKKPKCKASDALSGLRNCKVQQKKKGSKYIVTATATDNAGNVTTVKLTYKVKPK